MAIILASLLLSLHLLHHVREQVNHGVIIITIIFIIIVVRLLLLLLLLLIVIVVQCVETRWYVTWIPVQQVPFNKLLLLLIVVVVG